MTYAEQLEIFRIDWINRGAEYNAAKSALYAESNGAVNKDAYEKVERLRQEYIKADKWYHERAAAFEKASRRSE